MCFTWTCFGLLGLHSYSLQQGQQGTHAPYTVHHILGGGAVVRGQLPTSILPKAWTQSVGLLNWSSKHYRGPILLPASPMCTTHMYTRTFTSHVSTVCPVRRPSSPWPGDRSRQMLLLQAWIKWKRG